MVAWWCAGAAVVWWCGGVVWRCCGGVVVWWCGVVVVLCGGVVESDSGASEGGGYGDRTRPPCDIMMYPTYFFRVFGFFGNNCCYCYRSCVTSQE